MRLLVVDDHELFRKGLMLLFNELDESVHFFQAESSKQGISLCRDTEVDLVLLDLHMPGENGMDCFGALREISSAPIVMLSSEDDPGIIRQAIEKGAAGFIPKSSSPEVLIAALRLILAGGTYLPPNVLNLDVGSIHHPGPGHVCLEAGNPNLGPINHLSERQREVLLGAVQGKPNKVIARQLSLSEGTVKAHLSSAYRALGVSNRTEAVFVAAELGLVTENQKSSE